MRLLSQEAPPGTPVPAPHLFEAAWDECLELQVVDRESWVGRTLAILQDLDRYDIGIVHNGVVIGGLVLAPDDDPHVGECYTVVANYVLPEYRKRSLGLRCFRECIRIAQLKGYATLAYTHRQGDWVYNTIYRRLV